MSGRPGAAAVAGAAVLCFALAACGAAPQPGPAAEAAPTPAAAPGPQVVLPSGAVYALEIARTPEQQTQGLMFRESLAPRTGMLFLFDESAPHHFWMKNTMIPLDMIWLDESDKVLFVSAGTAPCRADPCPTYGPDMPARRVLEIAGGLAAKEGVTLGSTLKVTGIQP